MRILFDTNVVLDLLLDRQPYSSRVSRLFTAVEKERVVGYLSSVTITTIHYLVQKALTRKKARKHVDNIMNLFSIAPVDRGILSDALGSDFTDFEDAVVHGSALKVDATGIVTRNLEDFQSAKISVYSPAEFSAILETND